MNKLEQILLMDKIRDNRDNCIKDGYRVSWVRINYIHPKNGSSIEDYELPFDKEIMDRDINNHLWHCLSLLIIEHDIHNHLWHCLSMITPKNIEKKYISLETCISELKKNNLINNKISFNTLRDEYIKKEKNIVPSSFISIGIEAEVGYN
jgi:hypothetical protein